jgi:hypothetical protein
MYIYIYIYISLVLYCVCIYRCIHWCACVYIYIYIGVYIGVRAYIYIYMCVCVYIYIYTFVCSRARVCMYIYIYTDVYISTRMCVYTLVRVCVYTHWHVRVCAHAYIYIHWYVYDKKRMELTNFSDPYHSNQRRRVNKRRRSARVEVHSPAALWPVVDIDTPLTSVERERIHPYVTAGAQLSTAESWLTGNRRIPHTFAGTCTGFGSVVEFVSAVQFCRQWLASNFERIGFSGNCTGVDPIGTSHSTVELLAATSRCFELACVQMVRYLRYHA